MKYVTYVVFSLLIALAITGQQAQASASHAFKPIAVRKGPGHETVVLNEHKTGPRALHDPKLEIEAQKENFDDFADAQALPESVLIGGPTARTNALDRRTDSALSNVSSVSAGSEKSASTFSELIDSPAEAFRPVTPDLDARSASSASTFSDVSSVPLSTASTPSLSIDPVVAAAKDYARNKIASLTPREIDALADRFYEARSEEAYPATSYERQMRDQYKKQIEDSHAKLEQIRVAKAKLPEHQAMIDSLSKAAPTTTLLAKIGIRKLREKAEGTEAARQADLATHQAKVATLSKTIAEEAPIHAKIQEAQYHIDRINTQSKLIKDYKSLRTVQKNALATPSEEKVKSSLEKKLVKQQIRSTHQNTQQAHEAALHDYQLTLRPYEEALKEYNARKETSDAMLEKSKEDPSTNKFYLDQALRLTAREKQALDTAAAAKLAAENSLNSAKDALDASLERLKRLDTNVLEKAENALGITTDATMKQGADSKRLAIIAQQRARELAKEQERRRPLEEKARKEHTDALLRETIFGTPRSSRR